LQQNALSGVQLACITNHDNLVIDVLSPQSISESGLCFLHRLSEDDMESLTPPQINKMTTEQLESLTAAKLNRLTSTQVQSLLPATIEQFSPSAVAQSNNTALIDAMGSTLKQRIDQLESGMCGNLTESQAELKTALKATYQQLGYCNSTA
jgi:hypothetical protein